VVALLLVLSALTAHAVDVIINSHVGVRGELGKKELVKTVSEPAPTDQRNVEFIEFLQEKKDDPINSFLMPTPVPPPLDPACNPQCRWQCDDPICPSDCHPLCDAPECEIQCQEGPCADCEVRCEEPECTVRCPKDSCERDDCPKCETVCAPPQCKTICTPPEPSCSPMCAQTVCKLSCAKPAVCPRPKCELVCEKANCTVGQLPWTDNADANCCQCTQQTLAIAMIAANEHRVKSVRATVEPKQHAFPSLIELMHETHHSRTMGKSEMCCPCNLIKLGQPIVPPPISNPQKPILVA